LRWLREFWQLLCGACGLSLIKAEAEDYSPASRVCQQKHPSFIVIALDEDQCFTKEREFHP